MKSIGNGWKRAQEAQQRKKDAERVRGYWAGNEKTTLTPFRQAEINSMPYAEYVLHRRRTTVSGPADGPNWTTWQRVKRALRAL